MDYPRPRRAKLIMSLVVVAVVVALAAVATARYNRPLPALRVSAVTLTGSSADPNSAGLPWPNSGMGALATASGQSLGSGPQGDKVSSTASIAKLITIMTVLQKHPLAANAQGPTLTMTDADVALYDKYYSEDGSNVEVQSGEKLTEYQMLEAMLLPSGNNIADSLATWAYGSLDAYKAAATQYVASLGMAHTTIGSDASGFAPDTTSTANDLIKLGQAASKQPAVTAIAALQTATLPVVGTVANTNTGLGQDGIDGLKTGTSDQAGNCLVFTAAHTFGDNQNEAFVGVVLGAVTETSRFSVAEQLLESAYADYKQVTVAKAGQSLATITSAWGDKTVVTPASDLSAYTFLGGTSGANSQLSLGSVTSVTANQTVGSIAIDNDSIPLVTSDAISQPSIFWRIFHA